MSKYNFFVPHGGCLVNQDGHQVFAETPGFDWQLVRVNVPGIKHKRIKFEVSFKFEGGDQKLFYINGWGAVTLLAINDFGEAELQDDFNAVDCSLSREDGFIKLVCEYDSIHSSVSFGLAEKRDKIILQKYSGSGEGFIFKNFSIIDINDEKKSRPYIETPFNVVDVGAAFGIHAQFDNYVNGGGIQLCLFEPFEPEAKKLMDDYKFANILQCGLLHKNDEVVLNETAHPGCSSLLTPNYDFLSKFAIAPWFEIVRKHKIKVRRYDSLFAEGGVPVPHFLKLDIQGVEYEALIGFGDLLNQVLVLEIEVQFYKIYHEQKLFHEIIDLLENFGLMLHVDLYPTRNNFGNIFVEANAAYFIKDERCISSDQIKILHQIKRLLNIS